MKNTAPSRDLSLHLLSRALDRACELEALPTWDWDAAYDAERVAGQLRAHGIDWVPENCFAPPGPKGYSPLVVEWMTHTAQHLERH